MIQIINIQRFDVMTTYSVYCERHKTTIAEYVGHQIDGIGYCGIIYLCKECAVVESI